MTDKTYMMNGRGPSTVKNPRKSRKDASETSDRGGPEYRESQVAYGDEEN